MAAMAFLWVSSLSGTFGWVGTVLLIVVAVLYIVESLHSARQDEGRGEKQSATT